MPELCEITLSAQYLLTKLKNKFITDIDIIGGKYKKNPLNNIHLLKNTKNKIINIESKGKFMWFELLNSDNEIIYIMCWFGLTGSFSFFSGLSDRVSFDIESKDGKKYNLYFSDQRNFGSIQFTNERSVLDVKLNSLAPDLLKCNFSIPQFSLWYHDYINSYPKRHKMKLVDLLMRQNIGDGIVSGIGNYLSVEILYRAKLSPHRYISSLSDTEINELALQIKYVIKQCYMSNKTEYMANIINFIDQHNEKIKKGIYPDYHSDIQDQVDFEFMVYRKKFDKFKNPVISDEIIKGRTTYWVPNIQI